MAGFTKLNIVRDCWWLIPSGNGSLSDSIIVNESNARSSPTVSYASSLNDTNISNYVMTRAKTHDTSVWISGQNASNPQKTTVPYFGRLEATDIIPDRIRVEMSGYVSLQVNGPTTTGVFCRLYYNNTKLCSFPWPTTMIPGATGVALERDLGVVEKNAIYKSRLGDTYDWFGYDFYVENANFDGVSTDLMSASIYNLSVYFSGESSWNNATTGLSNVKTSYHYPTGVILKQESPWISSTGHIINFSDYRFVNKATTDLSVDNTYMGHSGGFHWYPNIAMYESGDSSILTLFKNVSGYAPYVGFNFNVGSGIPDYEKSVTKATLKLRMSLPGSGNANQLDTFTVQGWNRNYVVGNDGPGNDFINGKYEIDDNVKGRQVPDISNTDYRGYVLYGAGSTVGHNGFNTYSVNLNFINGSLYSSNSGYTPYIQNKNTDIFNDLQLRVIGLPSGTRISSSELVLEHRYDNGCSLYTAGSYSDFRPLYPIVEENSGSPNSWNGYGRNRLVEKNVAEEIFNLGYTDFTRNYTGNNISTNEILYSNSGHDIGVIQPHPYISSKVYSSYKEFPSSYTYRANQYHVKNLLLLNSDTTSPSTARILTYFKPNENNEWSLFTSVLASGNSTENTLFHFGSNSHYIWKITENQYLDNRFVKLYYLDSNGVYRSRTIGGTNTSIEYNNPEYFQKPRKYLISYKDSKFFVFSSSDTYSEVETNREYMKLIDVINLSQYSLSWIPNSYLYVGGSPYAQTFNTNFYLSEVGISNVAITGYNSDGVIDDSRFSRYINSRNQLINVNDNGHSGMFMSVPNGTGYARDFTSFFYVPKEDTYGWQGPLVTANNSHVVHPSAIYVAYTIDVNTNHPSGVDLTVQVDNNRLGGYGTERAALFTKTFPSGMNQTGTIQFSKQFGFEEGPLLYSDVDGMATVRVTPLIEFRDTSNQYYGEVNIRGLRTYFQNLYLGPGSGAFNSLPLYSQSSASSSGNLPLYTESAYSSSDSLNLYTKSNSSSSSLGLYALGGLPQNSGMPLYTVSRTPLASGLPTFIGGTYTHTSSTTLFTRGPTLYSKSGSFPMYMWATQNSGVSSNLGMFLEAKDSILPDRAFTMFIDTGKVATSSIFPMYIQNSAPSIGNGINFFVAGPSGQSSTVNFYIRGDGVSSGYVPTNASFTMYMARDRESQDGRFSMFMSSPTSVSNESTLFIKGAYVANSSVPMYINGSPIDVDGQLKFYSHGF